MRPIVSMTLAACAVIAIGFASSGANPATGRAAGAAPGGRNAGCDAVRYSLWRIDRA